MDESTYQLFHGSKPFELRVASRLYTALTEGLCLLRSKDLFDSDEERQIAGTLFEKLPGDFALYFQTEKNCAMFYLPYAPMRLLFDACYFLSCEKKSRTAHLGHWAMDEIRRQLIPQRKPHQRPGDFITFSSDCPFNGRVCEFDETDRGMDECLYCGMPVERK